MINDYEHVSCSKHNFGNVGITRELTLLGHFPGFGGHFPHKRSKLRRC